MTFNITVEQVQAFLQSQSPDEFYRFRDACDCIVARYAQQLTCDPDVEVVRTGIFQKAPKLITEPFNADDNENARVEALIAFFDSHPYSRQGLTATNAEAIEIIQDYLDDE